MQEYLLNKQEFWLPYLVATYAKTEPNFREGGNGANGAFNWRGATWIPTNYVIFHGLVQYGFNDVAKDLVLKTLRIALDENQVTREYYNSDSGQANGMNPFWGWSALAYVMPLDLEEHYDPMDLHRSTEPLAAKDLGVHFDKPIN